MKYGANLPFRLAAFGGKQNCHGLWRTIRDLWPLRQRVMAVITVRPEHLPRASTTVDGPTNFEVVNPPIWSSESPLDFSELGYAG